MIYVLFCSYDQLKHDFIFGFMRSKILQKKLKHDEPEIKMQLKMDLP
jgi:hypothetical protein